MTLQGLPVRGWVPAGECYALRTTMANNESFWTLFSADDTAPSWIVSGQGPAKVAGMVFTVYRAKVTEDATLRRRVRLVSATPVGG